MPRDAGCLPDGDISYDTPSRIEPKRPHQWFMDASEPELVCNKKQAIEAVDTRPVSGTSKMTISPWESPSSSGQFSDRLFGSATVKTSNLVGRSIQTIDIGNLNMERRGFEDQFGTDSSIGLSMSHTIEDTSFINYGGIRKVVNQVRDSEKGMSVSIGHSYSRGDNNTISIDAGYNRIDNNISLGQTYDRGEENTISMAPIFNKTNDNFISMGHTFNKGDGSFVLMGQNYNKGDDNILSMGQPFDKGNNAFISMGHQYENGKGNVISASPAFNKEQEKFMSMSSSYNKTGENFISVDPSYDKGDHNIVSMRPTPAKADPNVTSMGPAYDKGNSRVLSMGQDYNKACGLEDSAENNTGPIASVVPEATSKTNAALKSKEEKAQPKKVPPNNFPSNVKSLLSTGMLDGVPVKYFSWSRESLNAYEFERHATCKTKHPNSHIYFENGKTIYAVVQELKSTPQEKLFETIQNVTGSPINQKNFRIWKASFQAATRELQRIYGKDEVIMPS
ncbi:hypothetical protein Acr_03g0003990 [Actinidia rufa]|uniref:Tify domain-containing protein n=1 Tax=Actinidia rufa TaxID=165716 RepID=A0A7J0EB45_9ERIC|nr:hypothetical protein Acr_03g0003990 [Actinidia rufa]